MKYHLLPTLFLITLAACNLIETHPITQSDTSNSLIRRIYYNHTDNACRSADEVKVIINFNDRESRTFKTRETECDQWNLHYATAIICNEKVWLTECCNKECKNYIEVVFDQKCSSKKVLDKIVSITAEMTINKPIKACGEDYNCVLQGDETVYHFGSGDSAPVLTLNCENTRGKEILTE